MFFCLGTHKSNDCLEEFQSQEAAQIYLSKQVYYVDYFSAIGLFDSELSVLSIFSGEDDKEIDEERARAFCVRHNLKVKKSRNFEHQKYPD